MKLTLALLSLLCLTAVLRAEEPSKPALPSQPLAAKAAPADYKVDISLIRDTRSAMTRAHEFLLSRQKDDGSFMGDPAITGLVVYAFLLDPMYNPNLKSELALQKAFSFIESHVKPDGGIYRKDYAHYTTAVCLLALTESQLPKYRDTITAARAYMVRSQIDEEEGYGPDHPFYGGIGYGGDDRPDLSNTHLALEAILAADQYEKRFGTVFSVATSELENPSAANRLHWEKALVFLARCQNVTEINKMPYAVNDGGFIYETGTYKPERSHSYGSMTYAGVKSLLYAEVSRDDKRVQAAFDWIRQHYTWDENPNYGTTSLYYYYMTAAKSLNAVGEESIKTPDKGERVWREDLLKKILSLQQEDGSWVNPDGRYMENLKELTTAYTLIASKQALSGMIGK